MPPQSPRRRNHRILSRPAVALAPAGFALVAAAVLTSAGTVRAAGLGSIRLTAERSVLKADGRSTSIISAEVRDDRGQVVPDGTRVTFATTGGRLETPIQTTQSGVARVTLTAGDLPGTALITVNLETPGQAAPAQMVVNFTAEGDVDDVNSSWARIDGKDYVGYAADKGVVQAVGRGGKAHVAYRNVAITADTLQLSVNDLIVRANGNVTLRIGSEKRSYYNLRFDLRQLEGLAERLEEGRSLPITVKGPRLEESKFGAPPAEPTAPAPPVAPLKEEPAPPAGPPQPVPVPEPQASEPEAREIYGPQPQLSEPPADPAPPAPEPAPVPEEKPAAPAPADPPIPALIAAPAQEPAPVEAALPEAPPVDPTTWQMVDISDSSVTVVAKSIAIKPNETIQFRRATFYLDGVKTLSLPFHVMQLGQSTLFREQVIGLGPQGVTVDFPLYYDVRPGGIGTLHVRRGAQYGSSAYSTRPGWSLDAEQAYNGKSGTEGIFAVTGLTRQDWGARLNHAQRFGGDGATRGSFYVDFPAHRDLFGTAQVARKFEAMGGFTLNFSASGSRSAGFHDEITDQTSGQGGDLRGQIYADTDPHALLGTNRLQYSMNAGTARQLFYGSSAGSVNAVTTQSANLRLYTMPLPLSRRTSVRQSFTLGQTWINGQVKQIPTTPGTTIDPVTGVPVATNPTNTTSNVNYLLRDGASVFGTTALNQSLGKLGTLGMTYDYQQTPLLSGIAGASTGHHRLGMTAFLTGGLAWRLNVSASRALDRPSESLFADFNVSLGKAWSAGLQSSVTRFQSLRYNDVQLRLARNIGGREVAVYYSTLSRRFQFDLAGARF